MFKLDDFNNTLLELAVLAREQSVDRYQQKALAAVQKVLPFDMAWWGIMSPYEGSFLLHSSHLFNLPNGYLETWEQTKCDDDVARAAHEQPRRTTYFDEQNLAAVRGLATLTFSHGIGQAVCTSDLVPHSPTFSFLSLYRAQHEPRFTPSEQLLKQYLMPHLCSSWATNHALQIQHFKATESCGKAAVAVIDRQLGIVRAEAGFLELIKAQWPELEGGSLHPSMVLWLQSNETSIKLSRIVLRRYSFADFSLLAARVRTKVDLLTKRETAVAEAFSRGQSYKEIARELGSAPATVRHHLRMIYEKLEVSGKATMTTILRDQSADLEREDLISRHRKLDGLLVPLGARTLHVKESGRTKPRTVSAMKEKRVADFPDLVPLKNFNEIGL